MFGSSGLRRVIDGLAREVAQPIDKPWKKRGSADLSARIIGSRRSRLIRASRLCLSGEETQKRRKTLWWCAERTAYRLVHAPVSFLIAVSVAWSALAAHLGTIA
jgi:hypothetical protein